MQWQLLVLVVAVAATNAMTLSSAHDPCARVVCRAGRECVVSGDVSQCVCVTRCPDHDKPVCGTDGKSYDNHCLLHQHACLSGNHIGVDYNGYCDEDIALALQEFGITTKRPTATTTSTTPTPSTTTEERLSVCYGPQRDALRDAVISHWQQNVHLQPWHTTNMTYRESLSGHFFSCDKDRDYTLRPSEMLDCFIAVPFQPRPEQDALVTRTLCVDALIELSDSNRDWKLDFQEFTHLLDPQFHPLEKHCSLEGKTYGEGAEVRVECNHCVCATGSWVCATHSCPSETPVSSSTKTKVNEGSFGYMDTKYDLLKNSLDSDADAYDDDDDDDDDYYDDDDDLDNIDSKDSSEDYKDEIAKKEYNLLSAADKKKLNHLENNIRKFYNKVDKWESPKFKNHDVTTASLNSVQDEWSDSEESEETSTEEEEDDLLDQYDDLLERSQHIRDRLRAIRTSIGNLEEHRQHQESESQRSTYTTSTTTTTTARPARLDHVALNTIEHNQRPSPSRKHEKYRQLQKLLREKLLILLRNRHMSQTNNDIWEDQWKAKIKKHHHQRLDNSL